MKIYIHAPSINISDVSSEDVWKKESYGMFDGTGRGKREELCKGVYC